MEFCDVCENKMGIKWKNEEIPGGPPQKILVYYCSNCGDNKSYTRDTIINNKLYHQNYQIDKSYVTLNNSLLCEDPTLQKVDPNSDIKCPNCAPDKSKDITYYIYDTDDMKYLYICRHCKSSWKTE
tara:strand:+ start:181 stop:558 length:378 start_codon:yes stop_codon:yes gene_type:complete